MPQSFSFFSQPMGSGERVLMCCRSTRGGAGDVAVVAPPRFL